MAFIWPAMLALLLLVPPAAAFYIWRGRQRRRRAERFGDLGLGWAAPDARRHLPAALFLLSLVILIVALARPETVVSLPRVEGTLILAFDVSGSMAADDLAPNRMEAAKAAAREFVQRQPASVLIGVVAFSDSAFSVQIPTNDQAAILAAIDRLAPQRGTSLASGIATALNTLAAGDPPEAPLLYSDRAPAPTPTPTPVPAGTYLPAAIVLLTDGENNVRPDPLAAAQAAADRGVRIFTIGLGSPAGAILPLDGFSVHTQLDEPLLRQIAGLTGGAYYNAADEQALSAVYAELEPQLVIKPEKIEMTALFAGLGLLGLLLGGALSLLWFSRLP